MAFSAETLTLLLTTRQSRVLAASWAWLALIGLVWLTPGCAALGNKKAPVDPYISNCYSTEGSQVGWLWHRHECCAEAMPYVPREGDLIFTSSIAAKQTLTYFMARTGLPHHVLLVFKRSDGTLAALEVGCGGDRSVAVRAIPLRLNKHKEIYFGSTIAIRQIKRPLTSCESNQLTCFAETQVGKPFSSWLSFTTLIIPGRPSAHSDNSQAQWFCSELVVQALNTAGLIVGANKPRSLAPADLYHDDRCDLSYLWCQPRDWTATTKEADHLRPVFDPDKHR